MAKRFLLALILGLAATMAHADNLPRVASINLCTDQLVMALADPSQIVGLSPFARDPSQSWDAVKAAQFPRLSGEAEDILVLKPDIVVAGSYTKRATRELLKGKGLNVEEFNDARSLDEVKAQIRRMGDVVGHPDRATEDIAKLDAAIMRAQKAASSRHYRVLAVSRRGWLTGRDSLANSILASVGLRNAVGEVGFGFGGFASLETIISLDPDLLLVSNEGNVARDDGESYLLHPALEKFYPPSKRIVLPERLTICGGPMLADAFDKLTAELERIGK